MKEAICETVSILLVSSILSRYRVVGEGKVSIWPLSSERSHLTEKWHWSASQHGDSSRESRRSDLFYSEKSGKAALRRTCLSRKGKGCMLIKIRAGLVEEFLSREQG